MVTVFKKQNVYINRVKYTRFAVNDSGLFVGEFLAWGWDATDAVCLSHYNDFLEM